MAAVEDAPDVEIVERSMGERGGFHSGNEVGRVTDAGDVVFMEET